ncbi:type II toxin-antitoxin system HicB family antitoxin [Mycolicibacterium sp. 22603]|uniref:type II toxin-antitoxin system HicB family antitoxin n=1 Tax=Mycolicibacterium sp. 22603 TaxID=3453950 RepID=UPI003F8782DD
MTEYTYRAMWSPAAGSYVGTCLEFPGLRQHRETAGEAIAAIEKIVREDVAAATAEGWTAPDSLTDREYSGRFVLRISPELHAPLAVEATEQRMSLNQWVVQKLVGRTGSRGF